MATFEQLRQKVVEFTVVEDTTLDVWLELEFFREEELAAEVLDKGLMVEHLISQLDPDPTKRSAEEIGFLAVIERQFQDVLRRAADALARHHRNAANASSAQQKIERYGQTFRELRGNTYSEESI